MIKQINPIYNVAELLIAGGYVTPEGVNYRGMENPSTQGLYDFLLVASEKNYQMEKEIIKLVPYVGFEYAVDIAIELAKQGAEDHLFEGQKRVLLNVVNRIISTSPLGFYDVLKVIEMLARFNEKYRGDVDALINFVDSMQHAIQLKKEVEADYMKIPQVSNENDDKAD